jgi:hypothetical protein
MKSIMPHGITGLEGVKKKRPNDGLCQAKTLLQKNKI